MILKEESANSESSLPDHRNKNEKQGMVACSVRAAVVWLEARGLPEATGKPELHLEFQASLGYLVKPCLGKSKSEKSDRIQRDLQDTIK